MIKNALIIFAVAVITAAGGVLGYYQEGSTPSLVFGSLFGGLLTLCGILTLQGIKKAQYVAFALISILALFFTIRFLKTNRFLPAVPMITVTGLGLIALAYNFQKENE